MVTKRFSSSAHHDPTITQKVRTLLYEAGHGDMVNEIIIDGMRDVEQMSRSGLSDHENRLRLLEEANRSRITESGVWKVVEGKLRGEAVGWMKWASRASLAGLGAAALGLIGWVLKLAWKGLHT